MINDGNTPKNPKAYDKDSTGLHRTVSAFGIVGECIHIHFLFQGLKVGVIFR